MPRIVNGQIVPDGPTSSSSGVGGRGGCCGGAVNPACAPTSTSPSASSDLSSQHVAIDMENQGSYVPPGSGSQASSSGSVPSGSVSGSGSGYVPPSGKRPNNLPPRSVNYASSQRREEQEEIQRASSSTSNACWNAITYKVRLCGVPIPLLLLIAIPLALGFGWRYEAGLIAAGVIILAFGLTKIWGSRSTSSANGYRSLNGASNPRGGRSGPRVRTIGDLPKPPPRNT